MRKLPPLGAARAFEAAARHMSFTQAAAELCVTQAAVSHQVRQLEDWLGQRLFERRGHSLSLTDKGTVYLAALSQVFDQLATATEQVQVAQAGPLRVTALPSFAARWLLPRLPEFHAQHPDIDLRVSSSSQLWPGDDSYDLGIRSGLGRWPGFRSQLLAREYLSPVCNPSSAQALKVPGDLASMRLLHDKPRSGWAQWCDSAQVNLDLSQGSFFDDASFVLQAAASGQGVALGRLMLAQADIQAGRLVQPFALAVPNDYSYWIVTPRAAAPRRDLEAFQAWLVQEAGVSGG